MDIKLDIGRKCAQTIQVAMMPTESCEIVFHAEIGIEGEEKVITDKFEEKIWVPLYKNGQQNRYAEVIQYLALNDISGYFYNQDEVIQKNIAYKLDEMIDGEGDLYSKSEESETCLDIGYNIQTETESEKQYEVTPLINLEPHGLYGEVLRQYYEAAAARFMWETIAAKIYVNEGASNYYNHDAYAVYFQYIDLADDGTPELVIAIDQETDPMNIVDIFTIENDRIVRIIDNNMSVAYRNRYYICKDKRIKNTGSGGAYNSQTEYFKLLPNSSQLESVEFYVYNGWDGDYYSYTNRMGEEVTVPAESMAEVRRKEDINYEGEWTLLYERK